MDISPADVCHIEEFVAFVERRHLHQIALLTLEILRPFSGCLAIVSEGFSPLFSVFFGQKLSRALRQLLADSEGIALLITRIEESEAQFVLRQEECRGR